MPVWARALAACAVGLALTAGSAAAQLAPDMASESRLRVCSDPGGYPASAEDGSGYENRIAELLARELDRPVEYTWFPMSTGFIRNTLASGRCDLVIGYAQGHEMVLNTNHYMVSAYVLIAPEDSEVAEVTELSDPRLQGKRLGVIAGSPPATHLARHGLIGDAKSFPLNVDRRVEHPAEDMLADLESGEIDGALLWGPIGGPLVKDSYPDFTVTPLIHEEQSPRTWFRITMGVRQGEDAWKRELNSLIRRNQDEIDAILREAGVPLLTDMGAELKPEE